jgi:hypothetical protein
MPAVRDSSSRAGRFSSAGCGRSGPPPSASSSRSTPITSRRSSSAWCALARTTPAARSISPGGASGRNSSAPACMLSREIRCASTSCISRAICARSWWRACSTRSCCSDSARSARSRSDSTSCRRARTNMPPAITRAENTTLSRSDVAQGSLVPGCRTRLTGVVANENAVTTATTAKRRCTATVRRASSSGRGREGGVRRQQGAADRDDHRPAPPPPQQAHREQPADERRRLHAVGAVRARRLGPGPAQPTSRAIRKKATSTIQSRVDRPARPPAESAPPGGGTSIAGSSRACSSRALLIPTSVRAGRRGEQRLKSIGR